VAPEKGRQKTVKHVLLELESTRGGLIGPELDEFYVDNTRRMQEVRTRDVEYSYGEIPLRRHDEKYLIPDRWASHGRVAFRQNAPFPVSILGIGREVVYGGT
jgi:hypothetical protein